MAFVNNVMIIRRDLLTRLVELFNEEQLFEQIDRVPLEIAKRIKNNERCCVHKTRAVVKYKMMGILGFGLEDEEDELTTLATYSQFSLAKEKNTGKFLVVVHEACTSCVKANYTVTNLCKGCIAQPCINNCPKDAISRTATGQAYITPEKCVNCGICQALCPYHSIVYMPVPCEESCPVGAIKKDENGAEQIDKEKCILCGKCINACPFGSIIEVTELLYVLRILKNRKPITAIIAPSIFGQFRATPGAIVKSLKMLGFTNVIEVAEGAKQTTVEETKELNHKLAENQPFMTSSCCPSWTLAAERHIPEILPYVSTTPSPMAFTATDCKQKNPETPVVFIGPCLAKRKEGRENPNVDYVLTFEELASLFTGMNISVSENEEEALNTEIDIYSKNYCLSGGLTEAIRNEVGENISIKTIDGLSKKSLKLLSAYAKTKKAEDCKFVEVMCCEGGCIAGPCSNEFPKEAKKIFVQNIQEKK